MTQLEKDAAYYRACAKDCRRLRAAIEADLHALDRPEHGRDDVLAALARDEALWTQLADEIAAYTAAEVHPDLFQAVS